MTRNETVQCHEDSKVTILRLRLGSSLYMGDPRPAVVSISLTVSRLAGLDLKESREQKRKNPERVKMQRNCTSSLVAALYWRPRPINIMR